MIVKIRCSDAIGSAVLQLLIAIEAVSADGGRGAYSNALRSLFDSLDAITPDFKPEDLQFEVAGNDVSMATKRASGGPRVKYWAKLPMLGDGTFDAAQVDDVVRQNLIAVGAHTITGIIYQDIVAGTLAGTVMTEPGMRAKRMLSSGSSRSSVQILFNAGLIDRGPIDSGEVI